jgi:hypothetical protein
MSDPLLSTLDSALPQDSATPSEPAMSGWAMMVFVRTWPHDSKAALLI